MTKLHINKHIRYYHAVDFHKDRRLAARTHADETFPIYTQFISIKFRLSPHV